MEESGESEGARADQLKEKGNAIPEGLQNLINNLSEYGSSDESKKLLAEVAGYIKDNYLRLIDIAYTSNKGDREVSRLITGLTEGDPGVIARLCDLKYASIMAKNQVKKNPPEEALQALNARAALAHINAKLSLVPKTFIRAFTEPKVLPAKQSPSKA
ncbi:MAG TPA: hypothetical protein VJG66_03840 [Patescibacteria group bacterium]|nr:hypothetical protein [Patescibacteria group bacterium]